MGIRIISVSVVIALSAGCSGTAKNLPSLNPPEYDPRKVESREPAPPGAPAAVAGQAGWDLLRSKLDSLAGRQVQPEGKALASDLPVFKSFTATTNPCTILENVAKGLATNQPFAGPDGAALKTALGADAENIVRRMDAQIVIGLKRSLGQDAAGCAFPTHPANSNKLGNPSRAPRLLFAHASSSQSLFLAQTTLPDSSQNDYEVENPPIRREPAPADWVGYSMTDRMTRIGREDRPTRGVREDYRMVIAPKAKRCPHLEGPALNGRVDGTLEWSFEMFRAAPGPQAVLIRRTVQAALKGKVSDDAKLEYVDYDVTVTLQHIGTALPHATHTYGSTGRFTIDQQTGIPQDLQAITVSGFSAAEAQAKDAELLGSLTALMAYFSGPEYHHAQTVWNNPNTCVELAFSPATKTKKFVPGESTPVKTELRTKKDQAIVPAKFTEAKERPREGNGHVTPREEASQINRPATFTYEAPSTRVAHSGFRLKAVSRAGVAEAQDGEWELAPAAYVLEFESHIVQEPLNFATQFGMQMSSNGFDARIKATVPLRRREDGEWVGEGRMEYQTRTTTVPAQCEIRIQGSGTTTFHVNGGSISREPEPFAVTLTILPGQSGEMAETHCTSAQTPEKLKELFATQGVQGGDSHGSTKAGGWSAAFNLSRFRTFNMAKRGYEIGGWTQVVNSEIVAKKTMRVNCGLGANACQEETTLILKLADDPEASTTPP